MGAGASLSAGQRAEMEMYVDNGKRIFNKYSKETYRAARTGFREGRRILKTGLEVARALSRQVDPTNSRRNKAIAEAKEERRKILLKKKQKLEEMDAMNEAQLEEDLDTKLIIQDEGTGNLGEDRDVLSNQNIFEDQIDSRANITGDLIPRDTLELADKQQRMEGQALRINMANKASKEHEAVDAVRFAENLPMKKTKSHALGTTSLAVTKFKKGLETRQLEKKADQFGVSASPGTTDNEDTEMHGWNMKRLSGSGWITVPIYIIRYPGDCQREVDFIYSEVFPKLREKMFTAAIEVQLRDMGPSFAIKELEKTRSLIQHAFSALNEKCAIRIILLGSQYGDSLQRDFEIPELFEEDEDFQVDGLSILDLIATFAAKSLFQIKSSNIHGLPMSNTLVYNCIDPHAAALNESGTMNSSQTQSNSNSSSRKMSQSSPLKAIQPSERYDPIALLKRKNEEEKRRRKKELNRLSALVTKTLCQDPQTGKARAPHQIFMDLDEDGGGTVDKEEFAVGIKVCGIKLTQEEIDLLWSSLDTDGSGELEFEEMGEKFQAQYEVALQQELREAHFMPKRLSLKLEKFLPRSAFRERRDRIKEFSETEEMRFAGWLRTFSHDALDDLARLVPWIGATSLATAAPLRREAAEPLCFLPEVPEYECQADLVQPIESSLPKDSKVAFELDLAKQQLLDYSNGISTWPLALIGGEASGRTTLLCDFLVTVRKDHPANHLIFVSVGTTPDSSDLALVLLRVCLELGRRFNMESEASALSIESVEKNFAKLLLKIVVESFVIIILDGCDRLRVDSKPCKDCNWFPEKLSPKVKIIVSATEGLFMDKLRMLRSKYGGPLELHEVFLQAKELLISRNQNSKSDADMSTSEKSRASSAQSTNTSRSTRSEPSAKLGLIDETLVRTHLSSSSLYSESVESLAFLYPDPDIIFNDLGSFFEVTIERMCLRHGRVILERFLVLLSASRRGIIEQDLYELLNANAPELRLPFSRVSWQGFCHLLSTVEPFLRKSKFAGLRLFDIAHNFIRGICMKHFPSQDKYTQYHVLLSFHYQSKLKFLLDPQATWHGEGYRAITELCFHFFKASMWVELKETLLDLRYIEARCSLGLQQAWSLLLDYKAMCDDENAKFHWIKSDLLMIKDCYAMVKRYANTLCVHPEWTFSTAANLPDTTGPARIAKRNWTSKRESRPQLVWLNKPIGQSPCEVRVTEPRMVMHSSTFSRDMTRLVVVGQDSNAFVWRLQDGTVLCELVGHEDHIMACEVSGDDRYILTCSRDGFINLWNMPHIPEPLIEPSSTEVVSPKEQAVHSVASAIVSIPAHNNTVWTCAISTTFAFAAEMCELRDPGEAGQNLAKRIRGQYARQVAGRLRRCHIPITLEGVVKWTRHFSEEEKRKMRMDRLVHPKQYSSSSAKGSASASSQKLDDFVDQTALAGKIVLFSYHQSDHGEDMLWDIAQDLAYLGAQAVVFVNQTRDVPTKLIREPERMDIEIPIVSLGRAGGDAFSDGMSVVIRRELSTGNLIATGSSDCTVKLWDLGEAIQLRSSVMRPKAVLKNHEAYVSHVSFSHYGDRLASSSGDFAVIVWCMKEFCPLVTYSECLAPSMCSVWSLDDSVIGTACHDGYVRIWSVDECRTLKATHGPHTGHLWACAFANDNKHFATAGHEGSVVLWDLEEMLSHNKEIMIFEGHTGPISSLKFSDDSRKMVTASADRTVRVWRTDRDLEDYTLFFASRLIEERRQDAKAKKDLKDVLMAASKEAWTYSGAGKVFWEEVAHTASATCLCFSPCGFVLVTAGADFRVCVWSVKPDLPKPALTRVLRGHNAAISALAYAPDGTKIASGCVLGDICVWAADTGRRIFELKEHVERIWSLHFHPSVRRLASASSDLTVRMWRIDDPLEDSKKVPGLTIYSDSDDEGGAAGENMNRRQVTAPLVEKAQEKKSVNIVDLQESLVLQTIHVPRVIYSCCFSPNGKWLATASADSKICLYQFIGDDLLSLEEFKLIPVSETNPAEMHQSYIRKIAFDHNSRRILSCGVDSTLRLWSTRNSMLLRTFRGHEKEVWSCNISPDSTAVVSCSLDGTCRIWNMESGEELFQVKHQETIFCCDFSPDSRFIATGSYDGVVRLWEKDKVDFTRRQGRGWPRVRDLIPKIARMKDSPCALSKDGRICCYVRDEKLEQSLDKEKKRVKKALRQKIIVEHTISGNLLYSFTLNDPASVVAVGNDEGETIVFGQGTMLRLYHHGVLACVTATEHKASILDLRFSKDAAMIVSAAEDASMIVWKIGAGNFGGKFEKVKKLKGHSGSINAVFFCENGKYMASAGQDQCVKIWDISKWKLLCTIVQAHTNIVTSCAFNEQGTKLLSGGEDRTIRVWALPKVLSKTVSPKEIVRIRHLRSSVVCINFSYDGSRIVALLSQLQVYVWSALNGQKISFWDFNPFDAEPFSSSIWKLGSLSLTDTVNTAIVSDSAGNTCTFSLLAICSRTSEAEDA